MNYIQIIELELNKRNITAKKMLTDLGYSDSLMSKWKNGSIPTIEKLKGIADYLNISVDYILDGKEKSGNISVGEITANNGSIGVNNAPATITVTNGENSTRELSKEEIELLKIYNGLDVKSRHKMLDLVFGLEEETSK